MIQHVHRDHCDDSPASSPLTSLSSLDDGSELSDQSTDDKLYSIADIEAAQVPFPFRHEGIAIKCILGLISISSA